MAAATGSPAPSAGRGPLLWPWIGLTVVGVLLVALGIGQFGGAFFSAVFSAGEVHVTPYSANLQLDAGKYFVFSDDSSDVFISPSDVTVTGPDGTEVPLTDVASDTYESRQSGELSFTADVRFLVPTTGRYHVHVATPQQGAVTILIAPSLLSSVSRGVGWLGVAGLGFLLTLAGGIMIIVSAVRRDRHRKAQQPTRCVNGHDVARTAYFCPRCGAPVRTLVAGGAR